MSAADTNLLGGLLRVDARGLRVYSNDEVQAYLPVALLRAGLVSKESAPWVLELIAPFLVELGFKADWTPERFARAVEARVASSPVLAKIDQEIERLLTSLGRHPAAGMERAFARLLGRPAVTGPGWENVSRLPQLRVRAVPASDGSATRSRPSPRRAASSGR